LLVFMFIVTDVEVEMVVDKNDAESLFSEWMKKSYAHAYMQQMRMIAEFPWRTTVGQGKLKDLRADTTLEPKQNHLPAKKTKQQRIQWWMKFRNKPMFALSVCFKI
jgi:hypothetical protein